MDGSRFDAWTRRRFGLAAGGLAGLLLGGGLTDVEARRRRCRKDVGDPCKPGSRRRKCCKRNQGLQCRSDPPIDFRCCRKGGSDCTTATASECCSRECRNGTCFCKGVGQPCGTNRHCCSGKCDTATTFKCV